MSGPVETIREGRVLRIRMNQAERRNALSREMCRGLLDALAAADREEGAGAILLESSGPVFCAGWDPDETAAPDDLTAHDALLNVADSLMKPLIAAVQGPALGPGVALIANADVAIAAQGATFAMTGVRNGRFPFIDFRPLARAVGERRAVELCLTGRVFTVPDALAWGLVHHAAPAFEFDDRALSVAEQMAASGDAVTAGLRFLRGPSDGRSDERRRALDCATGAIERGRPVSLR